MKKLSKIDESLWGDIRDRVNDDSVRQEDDLSKDEKDILVNCISWFAVRVVYNQDYQPDLNDLSLNLLTVEYALTTTSSHQM